VTPLAADLSRKDRISILTAAIVAGNKGQAVFNATEAAKIVGVDRKVLPGELNDVGILASKVSKRKRFTAVDLAEYTYAHRISPLQPMK